MKLVVQEIGAGDWEHYCAAHAHRAVFSEKLPPEYDRIDYALLVMDFERSEPVGYMTVREYDAETAYLKHGGALPLIKGTMFSLPAFMLCLEQLRLKYKRITTLVENTNTAYLRMALKAGFKIIGIRTFNGVVLLELFLEVT